jgi:tetratricopeptide (TPR) repeat protein
MTKALLARLGGRPEEELAFVRHAIRFALEHDLTSTAATNYGNLSDACFQGDRYGEATEVLHEALTLARRVGDRRSELYLLAELSYALTMTGSWKEALAAYAELPEELLSVSGALASVLTGVLEIYLHRGQLTEAGELLSYFNFIEESIDVQDRSIYAAARAALFYAESNFDDALGAGLGAAETASIQGAGQQAVKQGLVWAVEAALVLGKREQADELLTMVEQLPPGLRPPFLEAHTHRFRARMDSDEVGFKTAAGSFREYGFPFWLAVTLLEHGELTGDESLLDEAREIFERLQAKPWLERLGDHGVRPVGSDPVEVPA